jgi:two-component system, response regulator RegA
MSGDVAPSLLIVEDDAVLRGRLARAFRDRGYEVREAPDGDVAAALAESDPPEHAVVDLRMPGRSGLEVVQALKEADPSTIVVVLTGYGSIATALEAVRLGATHYLTKPANADEIIAAFARARSLPVPPTDETPPSLARVEWEHINRVLADCGGNVSQAARLLGIHRRSLQRKLSKYPLAR